jgi:hypothetical protein
MIKGPDIVNFLCPNVEFAMNGDDFDSIVWINVKEAPITKKQYEEGFAEYEVWKSEQDAAKVAAKQAILNRIGLTADEAKLLLR